VSQRASRFRLTVVNDAVHPCCSLSHFANRFDSRNCGYARFSSIRHMARSKSFESPKTLLPNIPNETSPIHPFPISVPNAFSNHRKTDYFRPRHVIQLPRPPERRGAAAAGIYDFRCQVYDAPEFGALVSTTVTNMAVPVSNGLFALNLDFGASAFNGEARWLHIGVRTNGALNFTAISRRASGSRRLRTRSSAARAGRLLKSWRQPRPFHGHGERSRRPAVRRSP
jgi:hypothetical protein